MELLKWAAALHLLFVELSPIVGFLIGRVILLVQERRPKDGDLIKLKWWRIIQSMANLICP